MTIALREHNPPTVFAPVGAYTHGLEAIGARRLLFISGTMGLDPEGRAPEGIEAQCAMLWRNIGEILASADMTTSNLVKVTCFLRDGRDRDINGAARKAALGDHKVATTVIVAELLETDWLVEIDAIAAG